MNIYEIALELLDMYYQSEKNVIWEYSGKIQKDLTDLEEEVKARLEQIEALHKEAELGNEWGRR
jgi:hypothetical protein